MHFNNTGLKKYSDNNFIVNIQVPSIAAYIPVYKILTVKGNDNIKVHTVILDEVSRFDELFEYYQTEHDYLEKIGYTNIWNKEILISKSYYEFLDWHMEELVRLRFLPEEFPIEIKRDVI